MPRVVELAGRRGGQGDTVGSSPDKYLVLLYRQQSALVPHSHMVRLIEKVLIKLPSDSHTSDTSGERFSRATPPTQRAQVGRRASGPRDTGDAPPPARAQLAPGVMVNSQFHL
eukprot:scaffold7132_cov67-Phaeocystis_antarctica.AAC.4